MSGLACRSPGADSLDPRGGRECALCRFETSAPKYDWINRVVGLGLGRPVPGGVVYEVFELV
ncbi:MAG: DUF3237 family protein [Candidatus Rokubacteria bacterium]|nr:DUF3237 family protein [Candidatus Rokubacteria bacterium]